MNGLADWLGKLTLTQGALAGQPFVALPWQRKFLEGAFQQGNRTSALTIARGNGKTTFVAAIGAAAVIGPLSQPRAETIIVASSFSQARIAWEHIQAFLQPWIDDSPDDWRIEDSSNRASITYRPTGARVVAIGSDPRRAHGRAPVLVLADEPAQWLESTSGKMQVALETALGKIPGSRMIALGTQPAVSGHWFSRWLNGDADYHQAHIANPLARPFQKRTWLQANPSLNYMPDLEQTIRREAGKARANDEGLVAFRALRLNLGTSEVQRSELLTAAQWRRCEAEELPDRASVQVWGIDLGSGAAMSAVSAYWPDTGRSETLACFPEVPDLVERGKRDAVADLYCKMYVRGELDVAGERIVDIGQLLTLAMDRFGAPDAVVADRWREPERGAHSTRPGFQGWWGRRAELPPGGAGREDIDH